MVEIRYVSSADMQKGNFPFNFSPNIKKDDKTQH